MFYFADLGKLLDGDSDECLVINPKTVLDVPEGTLQDRIYRERHGAMTEKYCRVRAKCHNPNCANPKHLYNVYGAEKDNQSRSLEEYAREKLRVAEKRGGCRVMPVRTVLIGGRQLAVQKIAFNLDFDLPKGYGIASVCGDPQCVRPEHLVSILTSKMQLFGKSSSSARRIFRQSNPPRKRGPLGESPFVDTKWFVALDHEENLASALAIVKARLTREGDCELYQGPARYRIGHGKATPTQVVYWSEHGFPEKRQRISHSCGNSNCLALDHLRTTECPFDRIYKRLSEDERGCWVWDGAVSKSGRPVVGVGKRRISAAAIVFEKHHGRGLPVDWGIAQACGNKRCLNPAHMWVMQKHRLQSWAMQKDPVGQQYVLDRARLEAPHMPNIPCEFVQNPLAWVGPKSAWDEPMRKLGENVKAKVGEWDDEKEQKKEARAREYARKKKARR